MTNILKKPIYQNKKTNNLYFGSVGVLSPPGTYFRHQPKQNSGHLCRMSAKIELSGRPCRMPAKVELSGRLCRLSVKKNYRNVFADCPLKTKLSGRLPRRPLKTKHSALSAVYYGKSNDDRNCNHIALYLAFRQSGFPAARGNSAAPRPADESRAGQEGFVQPPL